MRAASTRSTSRWSGTRRGRCPARARAAAAAATGQRGRPVLRRGPCRADASPRGRAAARPGSQPAQAGRPRGVAGPGTGSPAPVAWGRRSGVGGLERPGRFSAAAWRAGTASRSTSPSDAGVAVGDGAAEGQQLGRQHRLGADDASQRRQPARVLGVARRSTTKPSRSCPANRTRTRAPGGRRRPASAGTAYSNGRSRWASADVDDDARRPGHRGQRRGGCGATVDAARRARHARAAAAISSSCSGPPPRLPGQRHACDRGRLTRHGARSTVPASAADGGLQRVDAVGALPGEASAAGSVRPKWP